MSLAEVVNKVRKLAHFESGPARDVRGKRNVVVLERLAERKWAAVAAEVGGERIVVSGAEVLDPGADRVAWNRLASGADVTLVADARRSVCRFLEMAEASPEQTRRMMALRLETELPYPVSESTWVCERQAAGEDADKVLVLAVASDTIAEAEKDLRAEGLRCAEVASSAAGLAQLALAWDSADEAVAVVGLGSELATLVVVEGGCLRYARSVSVASSQEDDDSSWAELAAGELNQSMYDYTLRNGDRRPARVLLFGGDGPENVLAEALRKRLGIPVEVSGWPDAMNVPAEAYGFIGRAPACVGTLMAAHQRAWGQQTAAPVFRRTGKRRGGVNLKGARLGLIAANVAALVLLVAALFGVRTGQLNAAERVIGGSRPLLQKLDHVQSEVDILKYESKRERSMLDLLLVLSEVMPKEVKIEELAIDAKGKVTISGKTTSAAVDSEKAVSALEGTGKFGNAQFLGSTVGKDGFGFRITCELRGGSGGRKQ